MYTYIIQSGDKCKIGYASSWNSRARSYRTHNPNFKLLLLITGDIEKDLHDEYKQFRIPGTEWFDLHPLDILYIQLQLNLQNIHYEKSISGNIYTNS